MHPLRTADALQLAAAFIAAERRPSSLEVVTLDERMAVAARKEGFVSIETSISRKIVDALQVRLTEGEERALAERPIENLAAYECYLKARHEIFVTASDALDRARRLVDDGLAILGENPLLLATKAYVLWNYVNQSVRPAEQQLDEAAACADKALARDPHCYLAIFARGLVFAKRGDLERALPVHSR